MQAVVFEMAQQDNQDARVHLDAVQILELVERGRRCRRYDAYIDHITECAICRETYKQLLQAEQAMRAGRTSQSPQTLRWLLPAAAAAVLILFLGVRVLLGGGIESAGLRKENGTWYEGAVRLPDWASTAAVQFGSPPSITRDVPRATPPAVRLLHPDPANAALEHLTPEFRWAPVPDATRYRAWLERTDNRQIVHLQVHQTRATLPNGVQLQAGATYRLTVEALTAHDLAGEGLQSVYEFRTLTPAEQVQLRWARAHRRQAPRACAVLFYRLGFYTDALQTLNILPDEPLVQKWRAATQAQVLTR